VETIDVVVGRIGKAHGLRGDVTINVRTDEPDRRFAPGSVLVVEAPPGSASTLRTVTVASTRWHSSVLLVRFEEVPDRTAAEAARGLTLLATVPVDASPDDPDEFYDHQLVGLEARTGDRVVGTVTGIVHSPHQDTLTIDIEGREVFVPFVTEIVPVVDVPGGFVTINEVAGLLDPAEAETSS
jgi:16S rRNA processing protein RimM